MARLSKTRGGKEAVSYSAAQTPPPIPLVLSSLQHMLLIVSLGMALPVSVARTAGLDVPRSASLLAAALFCMGITGILQTLPGRFLGSGFQSLSVCDSAALSACLLAAELGGVPLVLGMTVFSGVIRFVVGSFSFRMRKLFPPEVTGAMIFILGINIIPSGFKYFLGSAHAAGSYNHPLHLIVAGATLLFMLACTLFLRPLKPYTALAGIVFGFVLSALTGIFDAASLRSLSEQSVVALPIYSELAFSFDVRMVVPFLIVTIAAVVDNIGDFSACQSSDDPNWKKPDWRSVERGIRGSALGTAISGLLGGSIQSTATTNIGIAGASGITSRKVAYLACAMLMLISFFPGITGTLSLIPEPVLGAVLLYSTCYIMAGGFSSLSSRVMDDRRIFVIFLSIAASVSTLIPGLYGFLPESVAQVVVSPMVMGVGALLITTLFCRIGTHRKFEFTSGVSAVEVAALDEKLETVCREWGTERILFRKLQMSLDGLSEGLYERSPEIGLKFSIRYDNLQIKLHVESTNAGLSQEETDGLEWKTSSLQIALSMLPNLFENVRTRFSEGEIVIDMNEDI